MAPLAVDPNTEPGAGSSPADEGVKRLHIPIRIAAADEATLAAADGILTLNGTTTFAGITGSFYVTLSKQVPIQV